MLEFIEKTPDVLGAIEPNQHKAGLLFTHLQTFAEMVRSQSVDTFVFDRFYTVVHLIEENRIHEAATGVKELGGIVKGELVNVYNVFDRIVRYLM